MADDGNAGCLCGRVRLRIDGAPVRVFQCHCSDCRKTTGGGPALIALLPRDAVAVQRGTPGGHAVVGASGHEVRRAFCRDCGTPLYADLAKSPDLVAVMAGVWDADPGLRPAAAVWTGSAPGWHAIPEGIPVYAGSSAAGAARAE